MQRKEEERAEARYARFAFPVPPVARTVIARRRAHQLAYTRMPPHVYPAFFFAPSPHRLRRLRPASAPLLSPSPPFLPSSPKNRSPLGIPGRLDGDPDGHLARAHDGAHELQDRAQDRPKDGHHAQPDQHKDRLGQPGPLAPLQIIEEGAHGRSQAQIRAARRRSDATVQPHALECNSNATSARRDDRHGAAARPDARGGQSRQPRTTDRRAPPRRPARAARPRALRS